MATRHEEFRSKSTSFADFPDVVLLKVFSHFTLQELVKARYVCKRWNNAVCADILWKKFIPKWPGFVPPSKPSALLTVKKIWKSCVKIGNERWCPHPLPELVRYESLLRKAEFHERYLTNSETTLFIRLNPCYGFTTKGKDINDEEMAELCNEIWQQFKDKREDQPVFELETHIDVMKRASMTKNHKEVLQQILKELEPRWFLDGLHFKKREIDTKGKVTNEPSDQTDEEVPQDNIGDVKRCEDYSAFGWYGDKTAWASRVNRRLPLHLYQQIKALFADKSQHFIEYYLNDGCWNENYQFTFYIIVSDTAAFYVKHFYVL